MYRFAWGFLRGVDPAVACSRVHCGPRIDQANGCLARRKQFRDHRSSTSRSGENPSGVVGSWCGLGALCGALRLAKLACFKGADIDGWAGKGKLPSRDVEMSGVDPCIEAAPRAVPAQLAERSPDPTLAGSAVRGWLAWAVRGWVPWAVRGWLPTRLWTVAGMLCPRPSVQVFATSWATRVVLGGDVDGTRRRG